MPSEYDIDPNDIQLLDSPRFGGYPAQDTPQFPTYRDYPRLEDTGGVPYKTPITLAGTAVHRPQVFLGRTMEDVPGLVKPGTIDLFDPRLSFKDTYQIDDGGLRVILPKLVMGQERDKDTAIKRYQETGGNLGMFKDQKSADEYTQNLAKYQDLSGPQPYGLEAAGENRFGIPTRSKTGRKDAEAVNAELERQQTPFGKQKILSPEPQESLRAKDRQVDLIEPGNIDLNNLTPVELPTGGADTLRPMIYTDRKKKQSILFPTVIDGKVFSPGAAFRDYQKTGKHLGIFKNTVAAAEYLTQLQDRQNQFYGLARNVPTQMAVEGGGGRPGDLAPSNLAPKLDTPFEIYPMGPHPLSAEEVGLDPEATKARIADKIRAASQTPLPTRLSPVTGKMEEIDPAEARALRVPLGEPVSGGGGPRQVGGGLEMPGGKMPDYYFGGPTLLTSNRPGLPAGLLASTAKGIQTQMAKDTSGQGVDLDKMAKLLDELNKEYAKKGELVEDVFKSLRPQDPEAESAAVPKGQRPTVFNTVTGKFEEVDPAIAARLKVPLGRPRTTGEHAPEGGVIFSHEPWTNLGASNEPGVPAWYKPKGIPIPPPSEEESDRLIRAEQLDKEPEIRKGEPADRIDVPELDQLDIDPKDIQILPKESAQAPEPGTRQAAATANRQRLITAIAATEKAGYKVPHGIGTPNEPEGDRGPTRDMENLVGVLHKQEIDALRAGDQKKADGIAQARSFWEDKIKTEGMTEEQNIKAESAVTPTATTTAPGQEPDIDPNDIKILPKQEFDIDPSDIKVQSNMPFSPHLLNWVKGFEGWEPVSKWDYKQYSGGYGTRSNYAGEKISKEEGERRLISELTGHANNVDQAIEKSGIKLDPNQREALISFDYNTGRAADLINTSKSPDEIRSRMVQYNKAGGRVLPGLVERRQEEAKVFAGGAMPSGPAPSGPTAPLRDITPAVPEKREVGFGESFSRENAREILGMGESLNRLVVSPLLQGAGETAKAVVPDSPIAKFLDKANKDWQSTMVDAASSMRKSLEIDPNTEKQGLKGEAGGMIGQLFPQLLAAAATPGAIAVKFLLPAVTEGMDAMKRAREKGASPAQQIGAFAWGLASTEAFVNLPLHVQSAAAGPIMRFVERTMKGTLIAGGAHEALRDINNLITPITGGEQQPFSLKELAKVAAPMGVFGGVMGGDARTRPQGPIAEQAFPKGGEAPPPIPGAEVKFAPKEAPAKAPSKVAEALSAIPPKAEPVPTGEERFAPGASKGEPYQPVPEEAGAGVGLVASPKAVAAAAEVKEIGKEVKAATGLKPTHPFVRMVNKREALKQRAAQVIENMRKELDDGLKAGGAKTEAQRRLSAEAITNYLQAGGDRNQLAQWAAASKPGPRKGYEKAANLNPQEVEVAGRVRQIFNDYLHDLRSMGVDVAEFENYVTGMWQVKLAEKTGMGVPRTMSDYFRFKKQKFFKNYFEGEQEGYIPKTKDIRELLAFYMQAGDKTITDRQMLKDMDSGTINGEPMLSTVGSGASVEGPKGAATLVFPKGAPKETADGRRYKVLDFPALRNWKWVAKDSAGNPVLLQGDVAVHPDIATHLKQIFGQSTLDKWWGQPSKSRLEAYTKGITRLLLKDVQQYYKGTLFAGIPSGFHLVHQAGEMGMAFRINPFRGIEKPDLINNAEHMDMANHGLMLGPSHVSQELFNEGVGGGQKNLVTLGLRQLAKVKGAGYAENVANGIDATSKWLFQHYIPGLGIKAYRVALPRNMKRFAKELKSGTLSIDDIKDLTANQVNVSTGHQNMEASAFWSNKDVQQAMSAFLIAPHFTLGRVLKVTQAATSGFGIARKGREQAIGLGVTAAMLWLASRALNLITDGDPHFEWRRAFQVKVGNRWVGMRSIPGDIQRMGPEEAGGIGTGPAMFNKTTPLAHLATHWLTGRDQQGKPFSWGAELHDMIFGAAPMPIQGLANKFTARGAADPLGFWDHLAGAMGFPVQKYNPTSEVYYDARAWQKKNTPASVNTLQLPPSKYINLEFALEENDPARIKEEIANLKAQGMSADDIFKNYAERIDHPYARSQENDKKFSQSIFADKKKMKESRDRKVALIGRLQARLGPELKRTPTTRDADYFIQRGQ